MLRGLEQNSLPTNINNKTSIQLLLVNSIDILASGFI